MKIGPPVHSRFYNIWDCVVWNQDRNVKTIIKIPLMSEWLGGWRTKLRDSFADNQQIAQNILNVLNFPDAFKILKKSENGSNLHKICFSMTSFLWKDLLSTAPSMRKNVNLPWTFQCVISATLAVVLPCISNLCCLCTAKDKRWFCHPSSAQQRKTWEGDGLGPTWIYLPSDLEGSNMWLSRTGKFNI